VFILGRKKKEDLTDSKKNISDKTKNPDNIKIKIKIKEKVKKTTVKVKRISKKRERKVKEEIKHKYIPLQTIVNEEEVQDLINNGLNINKLPLIGLSDSGIRHLEVKKGNIIKIIRKNKILGDIIYYRRVVKD
jgi:DNA-directed RNA polymerase subunit H (RpoH/RPB5)